MQGGRKGGRKEGRGGRKGERRRYAKREGGEAVRKNEGKMKKSKPGRK